MRREDRVNKLQQVCSGLSCMLWEGIGRAKRVERIMEEVMLAALEHVVMQGERPRYIRVRAWTSSCVTGPRSVLLTRLPSTRLLWSWPVGARGQGRGDEDERRGQIRGGVAAFRLG